MIKRYYWLIVAIFLIYRILPAKEIVQISGQDIIRIPAQYQNKLGSCTLQLQISERIAIANRLKKAAPEPILVHVYMNTCPSEEHLYLLTEKGLVCFPETWTPPLMNHPFGFFLALLPADQFLEILPFGFIKKIDSAEKSCTAKNNSVVMAIQADTVRAKGWDGAGVRIAILDSGLDLFPAHSDLPVQIEKKDYASYPVLDDDVENTVTGHGTHVTGTVLGRGILSGGNAGNGAGAYTGVAPGADLVFLKIGNDGNGHASTAAMEAAMTAAVNTYQADIITMSYGGWSDFHDGSESTEQKVDWCYEQGVPVFISAGNDADDKRHYSGNVSANGETNYIPIDVTGAGDRDSALRFNLVWYDNDGSGNRLTLKYYNDSFLELWDIDSLSTVQSLRGTKSQIYYYTPFLPGGNSTFYLKIFNHSSSSQDYHVYEYLDNGKVTFSSPDPNYTISYPSTADHAFAVAAWTTRKYWTAWDGSGLWAFSSGETLNDICTFSSRGPRVDGFQKPDLAAPGSAVISIRDRDVYTSPSSLWIDSDGNTGSGGSDYYVMHGTSMACPVSAGAAALLLDRDSTLTPEAIYCALKNNAISDSYTGSVPNDTWGYGKLNVNGALSKVLVEVKVFLEGPYNRDTNQMSTKLKMYQTIPLVSPYEEDPREIESIPDNITDWILIELRIDPMTSSVSSKSAFIHQDGRIVDVDGITDQIPIEAVDGDYFIVINHRNHLSVMTTSLVSLNSNNSTLYDFSLDYTKYYGSNGTIELETGVWGMIAGDGNGDDGIYAEDYTLYRINQGNEGYEKADYNLDGGVYAEDYTIYRLNQGFESSVP